MAFSKTIAAWIATTTAAAALAGLTCAAPRPMNSEGCGRIPDVNDCIFIAGFITDRCLSECVVRQCAAGHLRCDQEAAMHCSRRADGGHRVGGFVPKGDRSCKEASNEVKWCDLDVTSSCKAQMAVHEIAHACGWHHRDGFNVPGDQGDFECR